MNTAENAGAKLAIPVEGVVYVVLDSLPKLSDPFIQYRTSQIFWNVIRLSLAILAHVVTHTVTPAGVSVYSLEVQLILCLTTILLLATVDCR